MNLNHTDDLAPGAAHSCVETTDVSKMEHLPTFSAVHFKCPLTEERIKTTYYIHTMEYSVQSLSRVQLFATPWTEKPGGLQAMGLHRVRGDRSDLARMHSKY